MSYEPPHLFNVQRCTVVQTLALATLRPQAYHPKNCPPHDGVEHVAEA